MVHNMLQALSSERVNGSTGTVSTSKGGGKGGSKGGGKGGRRLLTNSVNYAVLSTICSMLRMSHNVADDKCGDTHMLISEMGEKMLRHEGKHEIEKDLKGKTQEEINQMKIDKVPKTIYVDPKWYKQYQEVRRKQRLLPKDWYLGYGNQNNRASLSRRSTLGSRRRKSSTQRKLLSANSDNNNGKSSATTKSTPSKKNKRKQLPVERPTRFSNRGGRGKASPNYKERDR